MNRTAIALSVSILAGLPGAALAQSGHDTHHPASPPAQAEAARASSNLPDFTQAYVDAMNETHGLMMDGVMADDPDVAFVRGMIPHHQGAIDMARIVQQYGDDPQTKAWADQIIAAQEAEIAEMEAWLATQPQ